MYVYVWVVLLLMCVITNMKYRTIEARDKLQLWSEGS